MTSLLTFPRSINSYCYQLYLSRLLVVIESDSYNFYFEQHGQRLSRPR